MIENPSNRLEKLKPSTVKREFFALTVIFAVVFSSVLFISYQDTPGNIDYSSGLPIISIKSSADITNESEVCWLEILPDSSEDYQYPWVNRRLAGTIRKRNSDEGFSIELNQAENLFQIRNDDDWILLPGGNNVDALRTKLCFDFFNLLYENEPDYRLPQSELVDIYINGRFEGVFLLAERIDRAMLDLQTENINNPDQNDVIFKTGGWDGDFFDVPTFPESNIEQIYPNSINSENRIINLIDFVLNSVEEDFFNESSGIFSLLDKNSVIDNFLFGLFTGNNIVEGYSYYLVYDHEKAQDSAGFSFLPWRFEQSFGYGEDGSIPQNLWLNEDQMAIDPVVWSNLYNRLLFPEENTSINLKFLADMRSRWNIIFDNYWKPEELTDYFENLYSAMQNSLIHAGYNGEYRDQFNDTIHTWIENRIPLLNEILTGEYTVTFGQFESPHQEDSDTFGFSDSAARRHFYKSSAIFSKDKIHTVNITLRGDSLIDIIERKFDRNWSTEHIWMASNISIDEYSMDNVGVRLKANLGSLNTPKNSFKLQFSETELRSFDTGKGDWEYKYYPENLDRRFLGIKSLNLRAGPSDYSLLNEPLGHEMFKMTGNPYLRVSWGKLYITLTDEDGNVIRPQEYKGLYWITEHLDKTYLRTRFKNPDGNLYKTTNSMAQLNDWWLAEDPDVLKLSGTENPVFRRTYELKTNQELDDYTYLRDFLYVINYQWEYIEYATNLDTIAKYFAASVYQGSWDDYIHLAHNYYLYSDPDNGFVMIPWDIENNFNTNTFLSGEFQNAPLLHGLHDHFDWEAWENWFGDWSWDPHTRPLWDNCIDDPTFVAPYLGEIEKILNETPYLLDMVEEWSNLINETLLLEYNVTSPMDASVYGIPYTIGVPYSSFMNAKSRVINFLNDRKDFVEDQLAILLP